MSKNKIAFQGGVRSYIGKEGEVWVCVDDLLKCAFGKTDKTWWVRHAIMYYLEKVRDKIIERAKTE